MLQGLAASAAERGMTFGLEICNGHETNLVNSAARPATHARGVMPAELDRARR